MKIKQTAGAQEKDGDTYLEHMLWECQVVQGLDEVVHKRQIKNLFQPTSSTRQETTPVYAVSSLGTVTRQ